MDTTTQYTTVNAVGVAMLLMVGVVGILLLFWLVRRMQSGKGPVGVVFQQNKEALQIGKEALAAQKETNALLKQVIAKLDKKD